MNREMMKAAGWWAVAAGALGVAGVLFMLWVPPMVAPGVTNYPVSPALYPVLQASFALQQAAMAAALWSLHRARAAGAEGSGRWTLPTARWVLALLGAWEVVAIVDNGQPEDSATAGWVGAGYGVLTIGCGVALTLAGAAVARAGRLHGPARYLLLAVGVYLFVPLLPLLFLSYESGRLAIGGWVLLFGIMGAVFLKAASQSTSPRLRVGGEPGVA